MSFPALAARAFAAALLLPTLTFAQSATSRDSTRRADSVARVIAPVEIRATRSGQSTFTSALAISHVDRDDFATKSGFGLNGALSAIPGVLIQSRYGTSDVRIAIRGFGARGAGDRSNAGTSRGVRVLLDGMPETEPDGRTAFDNVDLATVESIDVIRSNASALWGNAAGGVISISTVPDIQQRFVTAQAMNGSFGLKRVVLQSGAPLGKGVAYASYVNTTFDGWRVNSDARRVLLNAGIAAPIGDRTELRVHFVGANNLFHVPGPLTQAQVDADPKQANATYNSRDERRFNRLARLGAAVEHDFTPRTSLSATIYLNPKFLQRSERGTFRDFTRYHAGANVVFNTTGALTPALTHRFTSGIDQAYQDGAILFYGLTTAGTRASDLRDNKKEGAYNSGVFAEEELTVRDKLSLSFGARGDAISYYNASFINSKLNASKRFARITPKLGASYRFAPGHMVYANVGGGVEAPAGNETDPAGTFGQDTVTSISPLLEPIRSTTFEVGTKHLVAVGDGSGFVQSVAYDGAAYLTNVINEIIPYRGGRFYFTAGKARRSGAELSLNVQARGSVRLEQAFTLSHNTYTNYLVDSVHYNIAKAGVFADYSGNKVVGVPDWFSSTNLVWEPIRAPAGLSATLGLLGTGEYFADDANTVRVPGSNLFSAAIRASRLISMGGATLSGFVSVENLTDRRYIGSAFLNPDVVGGVPFAFEPGMPRTVLVSFSLTHGR